MRLQGGAPWSRRFRISWWHARSGGAAKARGITTLAAPATCHPSTAAARTHTHTPSNRKTPDSTAVLRRHASTSPNRHTWAARMPCSQRSWCCVMHRGKVRGAATQQHRTEAWTVCERRQLAAGRRNAHACMRACRQPPQRTCQSTACRKPCRLSQNPCVLLPPALPCRTALRASAHTCSVRSASAGGSTLAAGC
jgi:hypothetical protein